MVFKLALISFFGVLASGCVSVPVGNTSDFNSKVLAAAKNLPATDPWLARMLREDFTCAEVAAKCRVREE